ncbi:glycosyltransferase family 9 protein [Flavobacterium crassostreae]|uniref:ADP-heptose--LPS heptosyltransferase n=1 Tax=Flavobacterium crassostreae TaxID=1763534 RepID=A0A1B9DKM4_9FLAO|nr:glycosyltransferase family 9 protein [Flavobacterium crassostreae]OCB70248.1 ADP-heptose--LPS heptosyltransferase [Flavobacterium crassostreae]
MSIKSEINVVRRKIMRTLTRNIGNSHLDSTADITKIKVTRILVCRPNPRLGNQLLLTPLLQEITTTFPDAKIDLFVNGNAAPSIFANYKNIQRIIRLPRKPFQSLLEYLKGWMAIRKHKYDIVINVMKNSSSGRLSAQFANGKFKFFGDDIADLSSQFDDYVHIAKNPVYNFRHYLSLLGLKDSHRPIASLDLKLTSSEIKQASKILEDRVQNDQKTIAIFTFATGEKCYTPTWWESFYQSLQKTFPDYNIVEVLPVENVSQIGFKAPTFYSKDIREIAAFIANTSVFIGADSGMMHLATASKTPTVGLFSITNAAVYAPYGNSSLAIDTNHTTTEQSMAIIARILLEN